MASEQVLPQLHFFPVPLPPSVITISTAASSWQRKARSWGLQTGVLWVTSAGGCLWDFDWWVGVSNCSKTWLALWGFVVFQLRLVLWNGWGVVVSLKKQPAECHRRLWRISIFCILHMRFSKPQNAIEGTPKELIATMHGKQSRELRPRRHRTVYQHCSSTHPGVRGCSSTCLHCQAALYPFILLSMPRPAALLQNCAGGLVHICPYSWSHKCTCRLASKFHMKWNSAYSSRQIMHSHGSWHNFSWRLLLLLATCLELEFDTMSCCTCLQPFWCNGLWLGCERALLFKIMSPLALCPC